MPRRLNKAAPGISPAWTARERPQRYHDAQPFTSGPRNLRRAARSQYSVPASGVGRHFHASMNISVRFQRRCSSQVSNRLAVRNHAMSRVVAVLFVALAMFAVRSDGAPDVAKMESGLRNALKQLAANDIAGAMKSVRAVSRCDPVPVTRATTADTGSCSNRSGKRALVAGQHDVAEPCWALFRHTRTGTAESFPQRREDAVEQTDVATRGHAANQELARTDPGAPMRAPAKIRAELTRLTAGATARTRMQASVWPLDQTMHAANAGG